MSPELLIGALAMASFLAAWWLTGRIRDYALRAKLIDEVNARGSHRLPTPRGGGASIVIIASLGFIASALWLGYPAAHAAALAAGGAMVALTGWLDDHGHVRPAVRLVAHFAAALWAVALIGPFSLEFLPFWDGPVTLLEWPLTVLLIVWMINLFNFMDGIDGIAASEAVSVTLAGAILLGVAGAGAGMVAPPLLLGAACLGFLRWNWPPAKIFMGDVSSGYLGFTLGTFCVSAGMLAPEQGYAWIILLAVFVADATLTLVRRALRRERVHEAHRSHAYQRLAARFGHHLPVTLGAVLISWIWLFPLAYAQAVGAIGPVAAICASYGPLFAAALLAGAGAPDSPAIEEGPGPSNAGPASK